MLFHQRVERRLGVLLALLADIEAAPPNEGVRRGVVLPTIHHRPAPALGDIDVVPARTRKQPVELALSNSFGFGGTNCCVVFRGAS